MTTVYVDILLCLNMFINYFILLVSRGIEKADVKTWRLVLAAFFGSLTSLYIFLPSSGFAVELLLRLGGSVILVLVAFGAHSLRVFFRRLAILYSVSFLFAGIMLAVWFLFKPGNMVINNGVVYFDISPLILILSTLASYFIIRAIRIFSRRQAPCAGRCRITVRYRDRCAKLTAILDSGNSIRDLFSDAPVIIAEKSSVASLLGERLLSQVTGLGKFDGEAGGRIRVIPYHAIGGSGMLPAFKCDTAEIIIGRVIKNISAPIIAISSEHLGDDYDAIINPEIIGE